MLTPAETVDYLSRFDGIPPESLSPERLSDGTWLLDQRAFWASLLYDGADEELLDALFGGGPGTWLTDRIDGLWQEIERSGRWPVLRFGAAAGDFALIVWHAVETEGHDFLVLPGGGRSISVAAVAAHSYGPGLSWPEAERLVDRGSLGSPAQRLLLTLRALGDAATPSDVVDRVASALVAVGDPGCSRDVAVTAARQLLADGAAWSRRGDVMQCDGENAVRRPDGLSAQDQIAVTRALSVR